MPSLATRIVNYWSACLEEEIRFAPTPQEADTASPDRAVILRGRLGPGMAKRLAEESTGKGRPSGRASGPPFPVEVMVAPWVLRKSRGVGGARRRQELEPLYWVPARLDAEGALTPNAERPPVINRRLLAPNVFEALIVAELASWEEIREHKGYWGDTWAALLDEVRTEFSDLTGISIDGWLPKGYRDVGSLVMRADTVPDVAAARPLLELCRAAAANPPALLAGLLSPASPCIAANAAGDASRRGHFGGGPRPNEQQASALRNLAVMPEGQVLAITGPPGTGKTAFLGSVMADLVVRSFLADKPPPVILLTSTNNQAVDNAVSALSLPTSGLPSAGQPVERERWFEGVTGYGCRWLSASQREKARQDAKLQEIKDLSGILFGAGETRARGAFWLERYERWSGRPCLSIEDGVRHLRRACAEAAAEARCLAEAVAGLRPVLGRGRMTALEHRHKRLVRSLDRRRGRLHDAASHVQLALDALNVEREAHGRREAAARTALADGGWAEKLLDFLPGVRSAAWERVAASIRREGDEIPTGVDRRDARTLVEAYAAGLRAREQEWVENHVRPFESRKHDARRRLDAAERCSSRLAECRRLFGKWLALVVKSIDEEIPPRALGEQHVERAADHLDCTVRRRAFDLAMRAREGGFLIAAAAGEHSSEWSDLARRPGQQEREATFRAICSVVPCVAATVFVAAGDRAFHCYENGPRPLWSFIDLVIVDEAGQVAPHLGLPVLALAKCAALVGDIHQLQPITNLAPPFADQVGRRSDLQRAELEDLRRRGLDAARGSVMAAGLAAGYAADDVDGTDRGIMLRHHYRCVASIIGYCNDLVYGGRLIPKVADDSDPRLPPLGYANIRGVAERSGSSWRNPSEAAAIARWIADNEEMLADFYGASGSIDAAVAVVTPYAAQKRLIARELGSLIGDRAKSITVDTVHALQGAEREVIVFSPSVNADPAMGRPYFDRDPNLLNVAVSRARKAFILFGDMRLCDPELQTPMGLLGRRLLSSERNRIEGVNPFERVREVERLVNAEQHDAFLRRMMQGARKRVIVSSFNAWDRAIKSAGIDRLTRECAARDVAVNFVIGRPKQNPEPAESAGLMLAGAGARVFISDRMHSKTLIVDDDVIVEGSFNWCGAYRDGAGNEERSFALSGNAAKPYVKEAVAEIRVMPKTRIR